jgi:hypothetical protein
MEKKLFEIVDTIAEAAAPTKGDVRPLTQALRMQTLQPIADKRFFLF